MLGKTGLTEELCADMTSDRDTLLLRNMDDTKEDSDDESEADLEQSEAKTG